MIDRSKVGFALGFLLICSLPLCGQVLPVPIPGGDIIPPSLYINQFLPGVGTALMASMLIPTESRISTALSRWGMPSARRPTIQVALTLSSQMSGCIKGNTWVENPMAAPVAQSPQERTARSWRYESTFTTPVRGHNCMTSIRGSRRMAFSGLCRSLTTRCKSPTIA